MRGPNKTLWNQIPFLSFIRSSKHALRSTPGTVTKLLHRPHSTFLISGVLICVICVLCEAMNVGCGGWNSRIDVKMEVSSAWGIDLLSECTKVFP